MSDIKTTLHQLKGARLHVLHALAHAQQSGLGAVGWQWLAELTGYGKGAINDALQALAAASPPLVQRIRHYEGWQLHPNAYQLPLTISPQEHHPTHDILPSPAPGEVAPKGSEGPQSATTLTTLNARLSAIEAHLLGSPPQSTTAVNHPSPAPSQPNQPTKDTFRPSPTSNVQETVACEGQKVTHASQNPPPKTTFRPPLSYDDHDYHDYNDDHKNHSNHSIDNKLHQAITNLSTDNHELISRLTAIGFDHARQRLSALPCYELAAWLLWWEHLPSQQRQRIKRPAGFIRSRLQKKLWPEELADLWSPAKRQPPPTLPDPEPQPPESPEASIWRHTLGELELQLTKATFNQWLTGSKFVQATEGVYTVLVRNQYAQEWLEMRMKPTILRTLQAIAEAPVDVAFITEPAMAKEALMA